MNRKARRAAHTETGRKPRSLPAGNAPTALLHQLQGEQHMALGQIEQARQAFEQALALDPERTAVHLRLGNLHQSQGNATAAIDCYIRAIELAPERLEPHQNLCYLLLAQGRFDAVAAHVRQILELKPDFAPGHHMLAVALRGANAPLLAFEAASAALRLAPTFDNKALLVACLQELPEMPASDETREWLIRAMAEPWGRASELARHAVALLRADPEFGGAIARAASADPSPADELFGPAAMRALGRNTLLHCLLENTRLADVAMERYLTAARRALLDMAASDAADDGALAFSCALARQCFINEYAFAVSAEEENACAALRARLVAALRAKERVPALWLSALAAYAPLSDLGEDDSLLAPKWPRNVDALLQQQVREPAEERRLRDAMPRLTPIADEVSAMVRDQYEQNPYPRWVKAAPTSGAAPLDARLRHQFPFSNYRNLPRQDAVDILVAGCGTGQQLVDIAQSIAGARVLAIDLSLASLSYAKRQTDTLKLRNIEYGQADILELGRLGRSFDVVDCGGVLHHLGDPLAGWRVLLSLVRPGGLMRIALYSEIARRHIVAARAFIAKRGYDASPASIRRFRQDVLALPESDPVKFIARMPDFFCTSDCRDLVFHVQEHRFDLLQIKAFLLHTNLEFLGFEVDHRVLSRYSAVFPEDAARTDLERWHLFEHTEVWSFASMYQFWVQKRA